MSGIQGAGNSGNASNIYGASGVNEAQSVQSKTVSSEPLPEATGSNEVSKPIIPTVGATDYAGATSFAGMYTQLIVMMCEVNRESYEANKTSAIVQMEARVTELNASADKRMKAAIVGLALGVVSGAASIAGGLYSTVSSTMNLNKIKGIHNTHKQDIADAGTLKTQAKSKQDHALDLDTNAKGLRDNLDTNAPGSQDQLDIADQMDIASQKNKDEADALNSSAKDLEKKANVKQDQGMREAEAKTAQIQAMTTISRAVQELLSSTGTGASGILSAQADTIQAGAEEIEASRQATVNNMQQFQEFMSKFNQILSSFLEAEMKAASAAAQA